jgi:glycosyltransferase involved in cell wall biosynthesis
MNIPVIWVGSAQSKAHRLMELIQLVKREKHEILHAQHFFTNAYAGLAARFLGLHGIGALRSDGYNEVISLGRIPGFISLYFPHQIVANSQNAIHNAQGFGLRADRLFHLPNVVDTALFRPAERKPKHKITILYVGSLLKVKRLDRLLAVLKKLDQAQVDFIALILGSGLLHDELVLQAIDLGLLDRRVRFIGSLDDPSLIYQQADIVMLTSDREGVPNVILEAMASGLPVIATRVGGIPEIIEHGRTGLLVEPEDAQALWENLWDLVQNPSLQGALGSNARRFVESTHSTDRLPVYLDMLYQNKAAISK